VFISQIGIIDGKRSKAPSVLITIRLYSVVFD